MIKQAAENLKATWIFVVVRLVTSMVVGIAYLIVAANIQYLFVGLLGETTFNYILGGLLSLTLSAYFAYFLGRLLFMFVRGWHVAAIAYASRINREHLPALDVGMVVFKKHFTSFAVVYGASALVRKFASKGVSELWELLKDVPYLGSLQKFSKNTLVASIGRDILDTAFDAVVYYIIKYTKPGLHDDAQALPAALRRYLYALPQVMITSLGVFLILQVLPKLVYFLVVVSVLFSNGIVAGILINVLLYPLYYVIRHGICDTLDVIFMISCYSKHCTEDQVNEGDGVLKTLVDKILDAAGFSEEVKEYTQHHSGTKLKNNDPNEGKSGSVESESTADSIIDVEPSFIEEDVSSFVQEEVPDTAGLPLEDEVDTPISSAWSVFASSSPTVEEVMQRPETSPPGLVDIFRASAQNNTESAQPPVTRLRDTLNVLSPELMDRMLSATESPDSSGGTSNIMGGSDYDYD